MPELTPSERRGAWVVVLLLVLGTAHDLWRAHHPRFLPLESASAERAGPEEPEANRDGPRGFAAESSSAAGSRSIDRSSSAQSPRKGMVHGRVDLNRATVRELDALPGIGPVLARRIVEHRLRHGSFRSLDELRAVRGIGPRLIERLREHVDLGVPVKS